MRDNRNEFWPGYKTGLEAWSSCWSSEQQTAHWHHEIQISVSVSGSGIVYDTTSAHVVPQTTGVVIPPLCIHRLQPCRQQPWEFVTVYLPITTMTPRLANLSQQKVERLSPRGAKACRELHQLIAREKQSSQQSRVLHVLMNELHQIKTSGDSPGIRSVSWIDETKLLLSRELDREVPLAELSERAGVSTFHFARTFRQITGMPPQAFHLQCRVNRARQLLRKGQPPADVAYSLGFADQSHLTRHFRKLVGANPGSYRRRARSFKNAS